METKKYYNSLPGYLSLAAKIVLVVAVVSIFFHAGLSYFLFCNNFMDYIL